MKYTFISNNERGIKGNITVHIEGNNMWWDENVGDIYNVIDYITFVCEDDSVICFSNFTDNKIAKITNAITSKKKIDRVEGVSTYRISKKTRGRRL